MGVSASRPGSPPNHYPPASMLALEKKKKTTFLCQISIFEGSGAGGRGRSCRTLVVTVRRWTWIPRLRRDHHLFTVLFSFLVENVTRVQPPEMSISTFLFKIKFIRQGGAIAENTLRQWESLEKRTRRQSRANKFSLKAPVLHLTFHKITNSRICEYICVCIYIYMRENIK